MWMWMSPTPGQGVVLKYSTVWCGLYFRCCIGSALAVNHKLDTVPAFKFLIPCLSVLPYGMMNAG